MGLRLSLQRNHFPGMKGLDIPTVWVFPAIRVCMDCGAGRFTIPEAERKQGLSLIFVTARHTGRYRRRPQVHSPRLSCADNLPRLTA